MKRIAAIILSVFLLAGLFAGCGKDDEKALSNAGSETLQSKFTYQAVYEDLYLDAQVQYVNDFFPCGDKLFLAANVVTGKEIYKDPVTQEPSLDEMEQPVEYDVTEQRLFLLDPAAKTASMLDYTVAPLEEGMYGGSYLSCFYPGADDTLWFMETTYSYYYDLPEDYDPESGDYDAYYVDNGTKMEVVQLDAGGAELRRITLAPPEDSYINEVVILADGSIYATDWQNVYRFDDTGAVAEQLTVENGVNYLIPLDEDRLGVTVWEDEHVLKLLDSGTMTLGEGQKLPDNCYSIQRGFGEYDFVFENNSAFYGVDADTMESERLFSWMDCDVDSNNIDQRYVISDDGTVYAIESSYNEQAQNYEFQFITLNQVDPATLPQKEELVLGCMYLDYDLRSMIVNFNRKNDDVRIVVKSYLDLAADGAYEDALQKLSTEILSGAGPDLLLTESLPMSQYAAKGVLADLWPLIDSDPELSREDLMTHLFDVMSIDGKLYQIVDTFSVRTAAVRSSIAQGRTSWTLDEVLEAMESLSPDAAIFGETDTKENMLNQVLSFNLDSFMDWSTGQCSFDSPEFISILEFANSFPKEFDYENYNWEEAESEYSRLMNGKQLMTTAYLYSFDELQVQAAFHGGDVTFIGYPSENGKGSCFNVNGGIAITSRCANVEGAWQFARQLLLEENQVQRYMYEFPTNRHAFETYAKQAMTPEYTTDPETGEQVEVSSGGIGYGDDFMVELYAMKQSEYDAFMELYENCNSVYGYDDGVMELIREEAQAYFDGAKSAEETARLIQDRVSLYLAEHM